METDFWLLPGTYLLSLPRMEWAERKGKIEVTLFAAWRRKYSQTLFGKRMPVESWFSSDSKLDSG